MSADRKARLDALDFIWDVLSDQWEQGFQHLQAFVKEHEHCRVPHRHVTAAGYRLGLWVGHQRSDKDRLSAARKACLDALGFIWDPFINQWEQGFQHLQAFVKEHEHCRVPSAYKSADGYRLGLWVGHQRRQEDSMPAARKARLDALGFIWDALTNQWEEGFQHLQAFVKEHEHCRVPGSYVTVDGYRLGRWVGHQRNNQNLVSRVSAERKARLDALGFIWDALTDQWEQGFQHLQAFVQEHGHCRVPSAYKSSDGYRLGVWVSNQRSQEDNMPADRKARLDALDFIWDVLSDQWEQGFQHLQAFVKEHEHCRVPRSYVTVDGYRLGLWVTTQRGNQDNVPADRKARLDALGFIWSAARSARSTSSANEAGAIET